MSDTKKDVHFQNEKKKTSKTVTNVLESDVAVVCAAIKGKRGRAPPHPLQRKRREISEQLEHVLDTRYMMLIQGLGTLVCAR